MNRFCNDNAMMNRSQNNFGNNGSYTSNRCNSSANGCGNGLPSDAPVAMAYVPWQKFTTTFEPQKALMTGTIFPELDKPFTGRSGGCCR